ncbi:reprolysin-like metallopeptidase [Seonamhaeicola maritimus]|uniref:zinc-dependent metalloprotease n=1 Tax=Seonamhaeicola maritimus TaxID=2591822 RepID=UPI002494DAA2|nr:zinc-dependent metalloprotease family protein [Seonamhaeicola maritimus]
MKQSYYVFLSLTAFFLLFSLATSAQNSKPVWTKITKEKALKGKVLQRKSEPKKAVYFEMNTKNLKSILSSASNEKNIISLPNADGDLESFEVIESSIMEPSFQAQHPEIRTYTGKSTSNTGTSIKISITPQGLHTMVHKPNKSSEFIDPISYGGSNYMIYKKKNLKSLKDNFVCHFVDDSPESKNTSSKYSSVFNASDGRLRTYDLALASTVEYSTFHIDAAGMGAGTNAQKKAAVLAAMVVTMNRVNGIFERELSLKMSMVNNDAIIFLEEDDGYTNSDVVTMLDENQTIIDGAIGNGNYDIGHVFATSFGGVAVVNSPCVTGSKAKGVTGLETPVGDVFDVEFVAHEMGHQFGAPHTWSANSGSCSPGEWSSSNSYEPGSGSTIMGYAGLCSPENVQANGDDYFHQKSLQLIWANISGGNSSTCDTESSTGNSVPTAIAGINYTIPVSTPYKLTGDSSDSDGTGTHTFTWEQYDLASSQGSIFESNATGPLVRSFEPTSNPIRYIPRLEDLIISKGSTTWEKLASVPRNLNFQFTVRDNGSGLNNYGQTDNDGMIVTVVDNDGAFQVTSQNTYVSYDVGSIQTITWDVAETNISPINTSNVDIKLSIDGGLTYPYLLLDSTDNDGSADVSFPPGVAAPFCRIMVEADPSENIFFNINEADFAIGYTVNKVCNQYAGETNLPLSITDNHNMFETSETGNVPESTTITDVNIGVDITHTYKGDLQIAILSPESTQINLITPGLCSTGSLVVKFDDDGTSLDCANTEGNEVYKPENPLSVFNGEDPFGKWLLGVVDLASGDTGTLNSWFVELCTTTVSLSNSDFYGFEKSLKVFPNPNKGEFTIKFNNATKSNIDLEVYDLRGRIIYSQKYQNVTSFDESINLNNIQSGMYILNLSDGLRQSTKKIIIE